MQQDPEMAGIEVFPSEVTVPDDDEEALEKFIREHFASFFHPTETCAVSPFSIDLGLMLVR
jgi:choline dehydrogenase